MSTRADPILARRAAALARIAAGAVLLIGSLDVLGWAFGAPFLIGSLRSQVNVASKAMTAVGLVVAGIELWLMARAAGAHRGAEDKLRASKERFARAGILPAPRASLGPVAAPLAYALSSNMRRSERSAPARTASSRTISCCIVCSARSVPSRVIIFINWQSLHAL